MNFDKLLVIIVIGIIAVVLFDIYKEYSDEVRNDELKSQQIAAQTLLQQQQMGLKSKGALGSILSKIPIIGDFY